MGGYLIVSGNLKKDQTRVVLVLKKRLKELNK